MKKKILKSTFFSFLITLLLLMILCNTCIFIVLFKLSQTSNFLEKLTVVNNYHVFDNMWIGLISIMITNLCLITMFGINIKKMINAVR